MTMEKILPMLLNLEKPKPLARAILRVVQRDMRNYFILISGKTQSRKSTLSIKLAMDIQPDWDMTKQMAVLSGKDYIDALMNPALKRGDVVVLDEIQSGLGHREWFSFINKALNSIVQTHGYRGLIVLVTTPYAKYVDSDTKALFDMWIKTLDKNDGERWVKAKVYTLEQREYINDREKKINILTIRPVNMHNPQQIIDAIRFKYPPEAILQYYYEWSARMTSGMTASLSAAAGRIDKKSKDVDFDAASEAEKIIAKIEAGDRHFVKRQGRRTYVNINAIRNELKIGMGRARDVKEAVETKLGDRIDEFVE